MSKYYCSCEVDEGNEESLCVMEDPDYCQNDCVYAMWKDYRKCPDYKLRTAFVVDEQKRRFATAVALNYVNVANGYEGPTIRYCAFCNQSTKLVGSNIKHEGKCVVMEAEKYLKELETQ